MPLRKTNIIGKATSHTHFKLSYDKCTYRSIGLGILCDKDLSNKIKLAEFVLLLEKELKVQQQKSFSSKIVSYQLNQIMSDDEV